MLRVGALRLGELRHTNLLRLEQIVAVARLRTHFGSRYDVRRNAVDWDYQMGVKLNKGASIVHYKQYMKWRLEGIAFEFGDQQGEALLCFT